MGSIVSKLLRICKSKSPKNSKKENDPSHNEEEEQMEEIDDRVMIERNRDNYFSREDFEKISKKFPTYKDWMTQSQVSSSKVKTKQKKIKWKEGEIIGNGSFGRVIMGLNLKTGSIMAVKQVQIGASNTTAQQERIKALEIEIELLSQLSHKNIVQYYGSDRSKTTFNIFLEYISGGTIASLIEKYGPLNENLARVYTRQILEGLEYLHVRNTIHRDIKGANVLVDNSGICKLADFGTAKKISSIVESDMRYLPSIRGTVNWMAPEVIRQTNLGRYSDIWSVGCTVLEMVTGKIPWSQLMKPHATPVNLSSKVSALYQIASAKSHPPLPEGLSPEATDFLKQCFKINPAERPNVVALLNHKFILGGEALERPISLASESEKLRPGNEKWKISSSRSPKRPELGTPNGGQKAEPKKRSSLSAYRKGSNNINSVGGITEEAEPVPLLQVGGKNEEKKINTEKEDQQKATKQGNKNEMLKPKEDDSSIKPIKNLRSLADVHNTSSHFDVASRPDSFFDEKLLKGDKNDYIGSQHDNHLTIDSPGQTINRIQPFNLKVGSRLDSLDIEVGNKDQDTNKRRDSLPLTNKKPANRPLGKVETINSPKDTIGQSFEGGEDDSMNIPTLGELGKKTSDSTNPYQIRHKSYFYGKEKDPQLNVKDRIEEQEHAESGSEKGGERKGFNIKQDLEALPKESRFSLSSRDSDREPRGNLHNQNNMINNSSIKTIYIDNNISPVNRNNHNIINFGESQRNEINPNFGIVIKGKPEIGNEKIQENYIGNIKLTQSLVVENKNKKKEDEDFGNENIITYGRRSQIANSMMADAKNGTQRLQNNYNI